MIIQDSSDLDKNSNRLLTSSEKENCSDSDDGNNYRMSFDQSNDQRGPSSKFINQSITDLKKHNLERTPSKNVVNQLMQDKN